MLFKKVCYPLSLSLRTTEMFEDVGGFQPSPQNPTWLPRMLNTVVAEATNKYAFLTIPILINHSPMKNCSLKEQNGEKLYMFLQTKLQIPPVFILATGTQ